MPLDDFRRQINPRAKADLELLGVCAKRYNVSLIAATLKWLEYTERRAVIVVSRDGFILWARSSSPALKSGAFFRTSRAPVAVPITSLAARGTVDESTIELLSGTWFKEEPCREVAIFSEQYEFTISLLLLSNSDPQSDRNSDTHEEEEEDLLNRINKNHGLN
jgi:hypothetical protein